MPADDISIRIECPKCDTQFTTPEGHLFGNCPTCGEFWVFDILWEPKPEWGAPSDAAKMRRYKGIHNFRSSWYSVEWGEPI